MLGSLENARYIKRFVYTGQRLRKGWEYLDSGAYRHVYRGPDGFVYKVVYDRTDDHDHRSMNEFEWDEYTLMASYLNGIIRLPETHYYRECDVIVMEYVEDAGTLTEKHWKAIDNVAKNWGKIDWEGENLRIRDGFIYVIDFAC